MARSPGGGGWGKGKAWIQWPNPHDDASAQLFPCLGLAPVYCDTHGEAARWTELKALLARLPEGAEGFGIPSGSGLAVLPDAAIQAMGKPPAHYRRGPDRIEKLT